MTHGQCDGSQTYELNTVTFLAYADPISWKNLPLDIHLVQNSTFLKHLLKSINSSKRLTFSDRDFSTYFNSFTVCRV